MPSTKSPDYQSLSAELDEVLMALQQPNVAVDEAVKLYEKGMKLVASLEKQVTDAELTLEKLHVNLEAAQGEK